MKKLTKFLLAFVIGITMSFNAMAQTADHPLGSGTSDDPYQISSLNNLYWITQNSDKWDNYFKQTVDIDASSYGVISWNAIGSNFSPNYFRGEYDGNNKEILNLSIIQAPNGEPIFGLFGRVNNGTIKNLGLINIDVDANSQSFQVGGLVGAAENVTIEKCYITGSVHGASSLAGGVIGQINGGKIENSYSMCNVTGANTEGGLIGNNYSGAPEIINCYSTSPNIELVGAVIGSATFENCFYDIGSNPTKIAGIGKTTTEMKMESTFTGWDFTNVWLIDGTITGPINDGYPYLNPDAPTPSVPLSDWAIYFGVFLIAAFIVVRYRRMNIA